MPWRKAWTITWTYQHPLTHARKTSAITYWTVLEETQIPCHTARKNLSFLNVYLLCSFIQCRPSVKKKRVKIELRGETLLNHYISLYRGGRGEGANEKTYAAQSVGSRKCHGNRVKKAHSNVTFRRKLKALSFCICSLLFACGSVRHFYPPFLFFSTPPKPPHHPHSFWKLTLLRFLLFLCVRSFYLNSFYVFWLWLPIITLRASVT